MVSGSIFGAEIKPAFAMPGPWHLIVPCIYLEVQEHHDMVNTNH